MRNARFTGWGAAALTAALVTTAAPAVAVPLAAVPAPIEAAATGDLDVIVFDDHVADGVYDTSKVARTGRTDSTERSIRLRTADGAWQEGSPDADGTIRFADLPVGDAEIHVTYPNGPGSEAFFDATGAASAADIERLPAGSNQHGQATGVSTVTIDEDGESRVIGLTGLRAVAEVSYPDGTPATGVRVELGSAGEWFAATEYGFAGGEGTYEAFASSGYRIHLPDRLGMRLTAPAGYEVGEVTAISGSGNATDLIPVTAGASGEYWVQTTDAASFTQNPTFQVTLAELPAADLRVTTFDDRYADGIFDATLGSGEKVDSLNSRLSRIVTSQGGTVYPGIDDAGEYVFADLPIGETKLYFTHPNASLDSIFFDATGAASADDISRIANESTDWSAPAVATVVVDEDGADLVVGFTALSAVAEVDYADGSPALGVDVEFGNAGEWRSATEYTYSGGEGTYQVVADGYAARYLPDEIGVRIDAPAGYAIAEVTAISSSTNTTDVIPVRAGASAGEYWLDTTDASAYFANPTFQVTLAEAPTATLAVTYFADTELDGAFQADVDTAVEGAEVYLRDAAGDWWATRVFDGQWTFPGVAPGEATIYAQIPEVPVAPEIPELPELDLPDAALALWDATEVSGAAETVRADTSTISFTGGSFVDPVTGDVSAFDLPNTLVGEVRTELTADNAEAPHEVLIGAASIFQLAAVVDAGEPGSTAGLLDVTFGANAYETGSAPAGPGARVATAADGAVAVFGAAAYSMTPVVAEGYEIVEVQAVDALSGDILEVSDPSVDGAMSLLATGEEYRVAPGQVDGPVGAVLWAVAVAPVAVAPVDPGTPLDPGTPGTPGGAAGQPAAGSAGTRLPATGGELEIGTWMLAGGLLVAVGLGLRVRRRTS